MALLISLFILFNQADALPKLTQGDFSAIMQRKVKPSHNPFADRQITFRVTNRSNKPMLLPGFKSKFGYFPLGYLIRLDRDKNQWVNPEGNSSHRRFKEVEQEAPDVYVLQPGKSMTFTDVAERFYIGYRFKRGIYISFSRDDEPQLVTSEEFILR